MLVKLNQQHHENRRKREHSCQVLCREENGKTKYLFEMDGCIGTMRWVIFPCLATGDPTCVTLSLLMAYTEAEDLKVSLCEVKL